MMGVGMPFMRSPGSGEETVAASVQHHVSRSTA